jgi:hypothetical protein
MKTRTLEKRKGAAPTPFIAVSLGIVNVEASVELNVSIAFFLVT